MNSIKVTSPMGLWKKQDLIGATVKLRSLSIFGNFGLPTDSEYTIESIGVRIDECGKGSTSIKLEGQSRIFAWNDLEILGFPCKPIEHTKTP